MSGRLRISGKKSYCPWKASNVQRVRRDEQEARARVEQEKQQQMEALRTQKWERIRLNHQSHSTEITAPPPVHTRGGRRGATRPLPLPQQHINLFAKEEREASEAAAAATKIEQSNELTDKSKRPLSGTSCRWRQSCTSTAATQADQKVFWQRQEVQVKKDREMKDRLDPMQAYNHHYYDHPPDGKVFEDKSTKNTFSSASGRALEHQKSSRGGGGSDTDNSHHNNESSSTSLRRHKKKKKRYKERYEERTKDKRKQPATTLSMEELRQKRRKRERMEKARLEKESL
jgi:hypothetical protein